MGKIKIFVSYKDRHALLKNDIITPIQTGRAIAEEIFDEMLGDDTGDNISGYNNEFCELSAIYWVWKHYDEIGSPEHIGFMHYRRHFLFSGNNYVPNFYGLVKFAELDNEYLTQHLASDNIQKIINNYDIIIPNPINVKETTNCENNYEHFKKFHNIEDYECAINILTTKYPDFAQTAERYNLSQEAYFLNMFIMKKQEFFNYSEWLFTILFELFDNINTKNYDKYQNRTIGFIAERLTGIYLLKLTEEPNLKIKSLPVSFIENYPVESNVPQNTNPNIIPIACSCSNEYIPYLFTFINSLVKYSNKQNIYHINILERNITRKNKILVKNTFENDNIKISFHNLGKDLEVFLEEVKNRHFTIDTFSRFFIPEKLPQYNKCLYLDVDIIIQKDVAELYNTDIGECSLGAARDPVMMYLYQNDIKNMKKYFNEVLQMSDYKNYFQNGVLIINLEKLRRNNSKSELCKLVCEKDVLFADQCINNYYFKDDVYYIDLNWNYEVFSMNILKYLPFNHGKQYAECKNNPYIIHYIGDHKPWFYPEEEFAGIWWEYARKTPFYEEILRKMSNGQRSFSEILKDITQYRKNVLKYWKYKLLLNVVFGKTRERYSKKKHLFKEKIRNARQYLK